MFHLFRCCYLERYVMNTSLFTFPLLVLSIILAYMIIKNQVYLFYGRALASEEHLLVEKNGYQVAIMDPLTDKWFFLVVALFLANVVAIFYFFGFLFGILSVINFYIIMFILRLMLPKESSLKWAKGIYVSIARREADYKRDGDQLRYEAMNHVRKLFEAKFPPV